MKSFIGRVGKFLREEEALTTVEYAVAGGLIALVTIGAFKALGVTVGDIIGSINNTLVTGSGAGVAYTP